MSKQFIETHENGVTTLTLNRPEALNAFSSDIMGGLQESLPRLAKDPEVRVVVLTGSGKAFSAGGDVKGFAAASSTPAQGTEKGSNESPQVTFENRAASLRKSTEISELLYSMPKPTIACIPGVAAGGGLSVALACDMRLGCASARITTAFGKIAVSGDYGGSYFLAKLVGIAKAKELYFTSEIVHAEEALKLGILNHVYPDHEFKQRCAEFIEKVSSMSPLAMRRMKSNLNYSETRSLAEVLDLEAEHMTHSFNSEDHKIGSRAFVTKEKPLFKGT